MYFYEFVSKKQGEHLGKEAGLYYFIDFIPLLCYLSVDEGHYPPGNIYLEIYFGLSGILDNFGTCCPSWYHYTISSDRIIDLTG